MADIHYHPPAPESDSKNPEQAIYQRKPCEPSRLERLALLGRIRRFLLLEESASMDYARREFLLTFRRIVAGVLLVTLLVAFWADRPLAAASLPKPPTGKLLRELDPASANAVLKEPTPTPVISLLRRPWLAFYQIMGAPSLNHGALSEEEESQFRVAVGCLAGFFFAVGILLWNRGQRLINEARKAT